MSLSLFPRWRNKTYLYIYLFKDTKTARLHRSGGGRPITALWNSGGGRPITALWNGSQKAKVRFQSRAGYFLRPTPR